MHRRSIYLCLLFGLFCHLAYAPSAHAQSCVCSAESGPPDALFIGTVIGRDSPSMYGLIGAVVSNLRGLRYSEGVIFHVETAWEGVTREEVTIRTGGAEPCGMPFERGETYLVRAWRDNNAFLNTSICGNSATVDDASAEIAQLSAEPTLDLRPVPRITLFEAAIFGIIALLIYWWIFMIRAIRANPLRF